MNNELTRKQVIEDIFDEISEEVTLDISKDDWLKLWKKTTQGDRISYELFMSLWMNKVVPNLKPEYKKFWEEN